MRDWQHALAGIVRLTQKGACLIGLCPFHAEKSHSFTVWPDGHYHCFGCSAHGWCDELLGEKPVKRKSHFVPLTKEWPALDWGAFTLAAHENSIAGRIARWRGYSERFCQWLIENGHVGCYENQICFPIRQGNRIVRAHVRRHESRDWKAAGMQAWYHYPAVGASVDAMVIRHRPFAGKTTHRAFLFESQWDLFALLGTLKIPGLYIATRGAGNARKLSSIQWPSRVEIWPQNDDAGEKWAHDCRKWIPKACEIEEKRVPFGFKDANEWLKL